MIFVQRLLPSDDISYFIPGKPIRGANVLGCDRQITALKHESHPVGVGRQAAMILPLNVPALIAINSALDYEVHYY